MTEIIHVTPNNDIREHDTSSGELCPCMPMTKGDGSVVVHMSYDGREIGEVCRKALDGMGKALADYDYTWPEEQRWDYEHAIHLLNMHYPPKEDA